MAQPQPLQEPEAIHRAAGGGRRDISDGLRLEVEILDSLEAEDEKENGSDGKGLTLLVADDDRELRLYIRHCVLAEGGPIDRVIAAGDGVEAMERLRREGADILVCDAFMPRMDGFALCEAVRDDPRFHDLPVLLITGEITPGQVSRRALETNIDAILFKPFNARRLCEAIEDLLRSRSPPDHRRQPPDRPADGARQGIEPED
jgi:CheY-like chemotaxis protein